MKNNLFALIETCHANNHDFIIKKFNDTTKFTNVRHNRNSDMILYGILNTLLDCGYMHEPFEEVKDEECTYTIIPKNIVHIIYREYTKSKNKDKNNHKGM